MNIFIEDFRCNYRSGVVTVFFLWLYRIGSYLLNQRIKGDWWCWPPYIICLILHRFFQVILNCSVPFSTSLGRRVCFQHGFFGVFISGLASIDDNVTIMHNVTIGSNFGSSSTPIAPKIGENVFIGVGAILIGGVCVGSFAKIGANALVVKDVRGGDTVVGPAAMRLNAKDLS